MTTAFQMLHVRDFRLNACLGILPHELDVPQRLCINASLYQGITVIQPTERHLADVLDYRKVRQVIGQVCQEGHIPLLETLLARVSVALMGLHGVLGVRVEIAKLDIFDDCIMSLEWQTGEWPPH